MKKTRKKELSALSELRAEEKTECLEEELEGGREMAYDYDEEQYESECVTHDQNQTDP